MKAVIVEIRGETAAALGRDGSVFKVKNRAYAVGQTIDVRRVPVRFPRQIAALAACAAALFLIIGAGIHTYFTPYSYVSLDVNPSIEYTLNQLGLVLSVEAVNGDGDELLQEIGSLHNRKIEEAVSITVRQIAADGYFDGDEPGGMVVAASSKDEAEAVRLTENVRETALRTAEESEKKVIVAAVTVGESQVQQAKELGVTPGKLTLVENLKETASNPEEIDVKEWLEKPVKEIMKETASRPDPESEPSGSSQGESSGSSSQEAGSSPGSSQQGQSSAGQQGGASSQTPDSSWNGEDIFPPEESSGPTPLEPKPSSKEPASSAAEAESGAASGGEGSQATSEAPAESGQGGEGDSGSGSSGDPVSSEGDSASHETPSGDPLEPSGSQAPEASSASSKRSSSKEDKGWPLPRREDLVSSDPWGEFGYLWWDWEATD